MNIEWFDNDRRTKMNRVDIPRRMATRCALGVGLLVALLLALGAAVPTVLAAISCPGLHLPGYQRQRHAERHRGLRRNLRLRRGRHDLRLRRQRCASR